MSSAKTLEEKIKALEELSACDISDALLKLQKLPPGVQPRAGQLADITPVSPYIGRQADKPKIIAPAVTFQFIPKGDPAPAVENPEVNGFPSGKHWVDWTQPGTITVINQPPGQYCAVLGGIMAARMSYLGVKGVVANGRVRDLAELSNSGLHVWSKATTTVGTGAEAKAGLRNVPIDFNGVTVNTGDIVFCDSLEGVVVIPQELLDDVLELSPKLIEQDDKVKAEVENGLSVFDAMQKHHTFFRSADMSLTQLYIANEIGREVVSALGEVGEVQFRDLNPDTNAFQRTFTKEIRRLDNVERQLRYFSTQMDKADIPMRSSSEFANILAAPSAAEIDELAERSDSLEQRVASLNDSYETLKKREVELTEWRWVLRETGSFFDRAHGHTEEIRPSLDGDGDVDGDEAPLLQDVEHRGQNGDTQGQSFSVMNIGFVAGVIPRDRIGSFERILWRTLRGNLYMNQSEIPEPIIDPTTNEAVHKNVFVIFAHGKEIIAKIRKISESLGANLYGVDENSELRRDQIHEVNTRLGDVESVLRNTKNTLDAELAQIARSLAAWMIIIKKEKAVYHTLNKFSYDQARKTLIAEAWCPTNSLSLIKTTLQDVNNRAGLSVPTIVNQIKTNKTPPSHIKTNKFTEAFQTIINAYGITKYTEVNPGLPTVITFPFLFAVMFGDMGHGFLMTLTAITMIVFEKALLRTKLDELSYMAFYGRYIMLMMGIFSMYTGLIYNDIFSLSLDIFPSQWEWPQNIQEGQTVVATLKDGYRYPFGLDWNWHEAENALLFTNSFKMKLSILLGWSHMTYSLCLQYINGRHFKSKVDILGNFVPGMIFFQSIFGYLVLTIVYKWSVDWSARDQSPPGLLNMLIFMFLSPGKVQDEDVLYPGQATVQTILLLLALVQVPIMLFLKPYWLRAEHNKTRALGYRGLGEQSRVSALDEDGDLDGHPYNGGRDSLASDGEGVAMITQDIDEGEHEEFDFSDVMIHQVIHTIEFCLNCISHTASYLRLWALSLAHQQLSIVLWKMTLGGSFTTEGPTLRVIMIVCTFYLWFFCTVAILCVMEGTSAMLHSLRLHWVEAMSKHFIGDGIPFQPFSFKTLLEEDPVD
ncbi:V-type H+-transporting ATPase subunit I [Talaromyces islandicus]|uniref:V-type H+-transporting ATPase subunit I n=1 Tax=Talaromyces islandicus TaxID=28573 RepID=A0A0U1LNM2_TALIS|nr:V-type H+-transporting ATPase subunit I [Talaromyces islandicus]